MDKLSSENKFAIMPEWVIELDVSHTAFRLYAVLARYADNVTHQAFPSLDTLADRLSCSEKTVRRAIDDLVKHGAITKHNRGRYHSNLYTVMTSPPGGTKVSDEGTKMSQRMDKNDQVTITTELEPKELEPHNVLEAPKRAHRLPEDWYPNERLLAMFTEKWPNVDRDYEIEQFVNYWHGEGRTKADWDRTFQVWMNKAQKDSRGRVQGRRLTNSEQAALLAMKYRQQPAEVEQPVNQEKAREIEAEASAWLKEID